MITTARVTTVTTLGARFQNTPHLLAYELNVLFSMSRSLREEGNMQITLGFSCALLMEDNTNQLKWQALISNVGLWQEPMSRSMQLNYIPVTAFS